MKKKLIVGGMSCNHCVAAVTEALEEIDGKDISIDLASKEVLVEIDRDDKALKEAIEGIGFDLEKIE